MKKLILLFIIGLFSDQVLLANFTTSALTKPDVVITIKLNLHSKKLECLTGFGFCKISINITIEDKMPANEETVTGKAFVNSRNQLIIKIDESNLRNYDNGAALKYFAGKKFVNVDASYELTNDLCKALGYPSSIVIKEGNYPVDFDQGVYTITINLL
jgi:hypothetical protein